MEIICASVCITFVVCFALGKKYRGHRALDETLGSSQHRMCARGNATSFPLPWQYVLRQLHRWESMDELADIVSLPRTGEVLAIVVLMFLKTADGDESEKSMASFIHQAMVRRDVVVQLIAG